MSMGLVNLVISTVGRCLDLTCLLLDLNFVVVHTVVQVTLAVVAFINSLPGLLLSLLLGLENMVVFCLVSLAEATSNLAQESVCLLGHSLPTLEGLLESLKMLGYLLLHCVLRGKDHLWRGFLSVLEACGIAVSLVVYFTNTAVNYALITTQNVYLAVASVLQTACVPLQKLLELLLTSLTFLHSTLAGALALLWSPCKLVLDFLVSLVHMFVSVFILNIYGLVLALTITVTTTVYLNPGLIQNAALQIGDYLGSFPVLRRLARSRFQSALWKSVLFAQNGVRNLRATLRRLYLLERGLWQQLSRHSSQLSLALRTQLNWLHGNGARGEGRPAEARRDPPIGRAAVGVRQELRDGAIPSASTDKPASDEELLTRLKEQEEMKKCVICQDCTKTVVLLPCRHLCLCQKCTRILLSQPVYQHNCPLCRRMILNTVDVYL